MPKKRRVVSVATRARLKALRKKHGLGEFQHKTRKVSTRHRVFKLAKRKRSSTRRAGIIAGLSGPVTSGVVYGVAQPFVSQFLRRFNIGLQDEFVQIIAALLAKNMLKNKLVTQYANAAIIVNVASLSRSLAGRLNVSGTQTLNTTTTTSNTSTFPPFV